MAGGSGAAYGPGQYQARGAEPRGARRVRSVLKEELSLLNKSNLPELRHKENSSGGGGKSVTESELVVEFLQMSELHR